MSALLSATSAMPFQYSSAQFTAQSGGLSSAFTPGKDHQPFLLCRQIARDNGESTNCRGCGIEAQPTSDGTLIVVTLAAAGRQPAEIRTERI